MDQQSLIDERNAAARELARVREALAEANDRLGGELHDAQARLDAADARLKQAATDFNPDPKGNPKS